VLGLVLECQPLLVRVFSTLSVHSSESQLTTVTMVAAAEAEMAVASFTLSPLFSVCFRVQILFFEFALGNLDMKKNILSQSHNRCRFRNKVIKCTKNKNK
jgi:hypothetical protein